jgi:hypothetical protein
MFAYPTRLGTKDLGNGEFLLRLPSASAYCFGSERTGWKSLEDFLTRHCGRTEVISIRVIPLRAGSNDVEFALRVSELTSGEGRS